MAGVVWAEPGYRSRGSTLSIRLTPTVLVAMEVEGRVLEGLHLGRALEVGSALTSTSCLRLAGMVTHSPVAFETLVPHWKIPASYINLLAATILQLLSVGCPARSQNQLYRSGVIRFKFDFGAYSWLTRPVWWVGLDSTFFYVKTLLNLLH
jgi:hypothetical protein